MPGLEYDCVLCDALGQYKWEIVNMANTRYPSIENVYVILCWHAAS